MGLYAKVLRSVMGSTGEKMKPEECDVDLVKVAEEMKPVIQPWMYYQPGSLLLVAEEFQGEGRAGAAGALQDHAR